MEVSQESQNIPATVENGVKNLAVEESTQLSRYDGQAPEETDFANYFCTYGYLYHQKDMMEDHRRTGTYYQAVINNRRQFEDKVVLDVGTGSGILALFCAQAGARKVYAVEATKVASLAKILSKNNQFENVIEVIQGTIESIDLPEKVDIIISEWMGYFLIRESMLDSVLVARDKFLKPGGALYPSHARLFLAPIQSQLARARLEDFYRSMDSWVGFSQDIKRFYNIDLESLSDYYKEEQKQYFLQTSVWTETHPSQCIGLPICIKEYDLLTLKLEDLQKPLESDFNLRFYHDGPLEALSGFFDVNFAGSPQNPADFPITLSTAPDPTGCTHWGQQQLIFYPTIYCKKEDQVQCNVKISRRQENHRLLDVKMKTKLTGHSQYVQKTSQREYVWRID